MPPDGNPTRGHASDEAVGERDQEPRPPRDDEGDAHGHDAHGDGASRLLVDRARKVKDR